MGHGTKWDHRFLALADHVAQWSKDPSTKVGAVIVRADKTIVSLGYNGFPPGIDDDQYRLEDRELKYPYTVHAEMNALLSAGQPIDSTMTMYVSPLIPCHDCTGAIIRAGIRDVVAYMRDDPIDRQMTEFTMGMMEEAGVNLHVVDGLPR